jgi:hypothetical protein
MMSEMEKLLNDIRAYLRISAAAASRMIAKDALNTLEKALIYSKLDGKISQLKIEADTKIPQATISRWLAEFVQAGLVSPPDQYNSSHKALFTLQELGIDIGTLKRRAKTSKQTTESNAPVTPQAPNAPQQGVIQKTLEPEKSGATNK